DTSYATSDPLSGHFGSVLMGSPQPVKGSGKHARAPTASPISPSQPPRLKIAAGFCGRPAPPSETARSAGGGGGTQALAYFSGAPAAPFAGQSPAPPCTVISAKAEIQSLLP